MAYNKEELLNLGVEEKIALAGELWDSIDENALTVSEDLRQLAEERYRDYVQNPANTISFSDLKEQLKKHGF